jgi:PEP-CTERM motif
MKRATGLVLAVLAFAVVTHADGIEYSRPENAGMQADLRDGAPFTEKLQSLNVLDRESVALRARGDLAERGNAERLTDFGFYSHFGDSEEAVANPIESDSMRLRLESIWGDRYDAPRRYFWIEHSDPFQRALGVQDAPEPGTLLLMGVGLAALAIWKRRTRTSEQPFVRYF